MKNNMGKRACDVGTHTVLIAFSYFNQEPSFDTQTLNHCLEFPLHIWAIDNLLCNIFVNGQIARAKVSDMNDFYYVSESDPFQLVDDVGLIDDVWS